MQTRHLSTRWAETGYASALAAFVVSAFFFVDVFGEYFVNTSYFYCILGLAGVLALILFLVRKRIWRKKGGTWGEEDYFQ